VIAVLLALALQAGFYLTRLRFGSWVRPGRFLSSASDALVMAFSTASSAATLPVTYASVKDGMKVREESAGLGVMVGGTFNHDGTALYEAMAALFIGQALGQHLGLGQQVLVVLMSILASVGAAGIPEAGLVTMLAVFSAVHLPTEYIPLLLPLDWFLDRCRTAINVMGDMTVTCLLDGKTQAALPQPEEETVSGASPTPAV
jgi:DAACS family dicarboxylate/amino acid:cation (Na+ or H+) symporter